MAVCTSDLKPDKMKTPLIGNPLWGVKMLTLLSKQPSRFDTARFIFYIHTHTHSTYKTFPGGAIAKTPKSP